ncbi:MAG: ABC transporter ATP-binding protein [Elusimicrobia bacterium]|nr:ABC transporter ATP-binding protein [Elusimicrobiota bacterium]
MPEPRVALDGVEMSFDGVRALDGFSFAAGAGEIVGLLGPNGAGKTTALHILLGFLKPTKGEVRVLGMSPFERRYDVYARVNFTSAYVQLPFNLTVERNLRIFAELYNVPEPEKKISALVERLGLGALRKAKTGALSSGEQTRLNLAKSLLNDPEVIFLDEPTASLDPDIADRVRELLKAERKERGVTMVYTSHNMAEVEALCDRVIFLNKGRKIAEGTPAEIRAKFGQETLEGVFLKVSREGAE